MKDLESKGLFWRLAGAKTAAQVSQELGGAKALEALLRQTGYARQPQGLAARLAKEVQHGLPLRLGPEQRLDFGRFFDAPVLMDQARQEADRRLPPPPKGPRPARQLNLSPEEAAAQWPWTSGQRFLRLARANFLVPSDDLAQAALESLADFLAANPPLLGPGWADGRVMALRAANWLWGLRFMAKALAGDPKLAAGVVLHLSLLGQALAALLEADQAAPTADLVGPAGALLMLGVALPFLEGAAPWTALAAACLGPALMAAWQSGPAPATPRLAEACEWGGLSLWLAGQHQLDLPQALGGLNKLAGLCRALSPPWGAGAYWGQESGGAVLGLDPAPASCFSAPANLAAVLLNAPELRAQRQLDERLFWLMGPEAAERLRLLAGAPPPLPLEAPGPGLGVLCAPLAGRKLGAALCLGAGDPAAALSLVLSLDGQGFILPPGPAGSGPLAPHLRARAAHNALRIDEAEPQGGAVTLEGLQSGVRYRFLAASYDGYAHLADPVILRRRVYLDLARGLVNIVDQVQARGRHLCEVFFRLPVDCQVQSLAEGVLLLEGEFGRAILRPEAKAHVSLFLGRSNPTLGWLASRLGQVVPAPVVRIQAVVEGNARLTTVLALEALA